MAFLHDIVGKRFTVQEFAAYMASFAMGAWHPSFVVLHNTGMPTLAMRPQGLTYQHILNIRYDYEVRQKWSAGPHLFVDQNGIWAFSPLNYPGVHAPSWNSESWGVETLGDYDTEAFLPSVRTNLVAALTELHRLGKLDPSTLHLHKEDPKTTHKRCPGNNISKSDIISQIRAGLQ